MSTVPTYFTKITPDQARGLCDGCSLRRGSVRVRSDNSKLVIALFYSLPPPALSHLRPFLSSQVVPMTTNVFPMQMLHSGAFLRPYKLQRLRQPSILSLLLACRTHYLLTPVCGLLALASWLGTHGCGPLAEDSWVCGLLAV